MKKTISTILTMAFSIIALLAQEPQNDGLWAYYMFNGNADNEVVDTNGTVYNATLTSDRYNRDNSSYRFVRNDSCVISFGDSYDTLFAGDNKSFALSVWIKPDSISQNMMIVSKYGHSVEHNREFFLRVLDTVVDFGFYSSLTGGNAVIYRSETRIDDTTKWYNVVVNYLDKASVDTFPERVEMYINNNKENLEISLAQTTSPTFIKDGTAPLCIGGVLATDDSTYLGHGYGFNGKIDDLIIYNKSLGDEDVNILFTEDPLNSSIILSTSVVSTNIEGRVSIFPNPAQDLLTIEFKNSDSKTIEIIDLSGKTIYKTDVTSNRLTINMNEIDHDSGIVFVRIIDRNFNIVDNQKIAIY